MVGYKLSKNDWVTPFFVIFRSVREILLVTVFLEHPVPIVFHFGTENWEEQLKKTPCIRWTVMMISARFLIGVLSEVFHNSITFGWPSNPNWAQDHK